MRKRILVLYTLYMDMLLVEFWSWSL